MERLSGETIINIQIAIKEGKRICDISRQFNIPRSTARYYFPQFEGYEKSEKRRRVRREYAQKHKEQIRVNWQKWYEKNKEYRLRYLSRAWHKRRSKEVGGKIYSSDEWKELKEKYNYTCPACGKREPDIKLTLDHVLPIILGGDNSIENIQPLCKSCNSRKGTKIIKYTLNEYRR